MYPFDILMNMNTTTVTIECRYGLSYSDGL